MTKVMLTTVDNPYHPFNDYDNWLRYDVSQGYYTNALLARMTTHSDELSQSLQDEAVEIAIDEIIKIDPTLTYRKVSKDSIL